MRSITEAWLARAFDPNPGLRFDDVEWSWSDAVGEAGRRATWWRATSVSPVRPTSPSCSTTCRSTRGGSVRALSGSVYVGANSTHRGAALAEELTYTRCQLLVTDLTHLKLVDGLDLGPRIGAASVDNPRVFIVDAGRAVLPPPAALPSPDDIDPRALGYLIFTSGTSGAPKACRCTQGRMAAVGSVLADRYLGPGDCCYLAMPLFHSNALMAGWAPAVVGGATIALPTRGRFSASGFLPDVRRHRATYFNYVGRPLSYVLATPDRPDDADNPLKYVFGNEAAPGDVERFARRFGCDVSENYGSTEGGVAVSRTPDTPEGALGPPPPGVLVVRDDCSECALAEFDDAGRLVNAEAAIGEMVSTTGRGAFEGYWENEAANERRTRNGWYWTGDLVYKDADGYLWFAGRADDWLRVDGENFAAAPIARLVERHPDVVLAAVYAVPDPVVGDRVMVAVQLRPGVAFDGDAFGRFLAEQPDLGTKWVPRYVRVSGALPTTATAKLLVRQLRAEGLDCADPVWELVGRNPWAYADIRP